MTTHPVPVVIAAMLARCRAAPALTGVRIDDGPPVADYAEPDAVAVGLSVADVAAATTDTGYGYAAVTTRFVLNCVAQSWSGDSDDLASCRTRVFELLDIVAGELAADPHLGGVCDWARVIRSAYRPVQGQEGALALIEFSVQVDATRDGG